MRWNRTILLSTVALGVLAAPVAADTLAGSDDIAADHPHAASIEWLTSHGITQGCTPALYCPDDDVSRAQMATLLHRLAEAGIVDAATVEGFSAKDLQGQVGPTGEQGDTGPTGATGSVGLAGEPGPRGPSGAAGTDGIDGTDGADGINGTDGIDGTAGADGINGRDGTDGADGIDGTDGTDGATILGANGVPGADLGEIGDLYLDLDDTHLYGPKDADGWGTGVSLIGPKGDQGDQGETGAQGSQGETGSQGAQGETGSQGARGEAGEQGVQGPAGQDGADGTHGTDGVDGATWLSGSGVPDAGLGVDGDLYLDTDASSYYGPKAAGAWGEAQSLVGPEGEQGIQGEPGQDGGGAITTTRETSGPVSVPKFAEGRNPPPIAQATATCPGGPGAVLSGGFLPEGPEAGTEVTVFASHPTGDLSGWTVEAWNGFGDDSTITAYAVCMALP